MAIALLVFAVVVTATAAGIALNRILPEHHLSKESKEIIHLGIGVIVTLTALVLGLLVASAKSSFDSKSDEIRHGSVKILMVDRLLRAMARRVRRHETRFSVGSTTTRAPSGHPKIERFPSSKATPNGGNSTSRFESSRPRTMGKRHCRRRSSMP